MIKSEYWEEYDMKPVINTLHKVTAETKLLHFMIIKNEDKGKRGNIVYSLVKFNDRPKPISIDWWVIKNKVGINKVFDMRISGIWMAQEQRSTFTSFLSKNNGDINKLINRLNSETR